MMNLLHKSMVFLPKCFTENVSLYNRNNIVTFDLLDQLFYTWLMFSCLNLYILWLYAQAVV